MMAYGILQRPEENIFTVNTEDMVFPDSDNEEEEIPKIRGPKNEPGETSGLEGRNSYKEFFIPKNLHPSDKIPQNIIDIDCDKGRKAKIDSWIAEISLSVQTNLKGFNNTHIACS